MGSLRKFFGNPLSSFLDAKGTLSILIVILGGMSNALWIWHKEGICLRVFQGLLTPLYNYVFFPVKVALMAIDNYRWEEDGVEEGDGQADDREVDVGEVHLNVLGEK